MLDDGYRGCLRILCQVRVFDLPKDAFVEGTIRLGLPRYNRNLVDGSTLSFDEIRAVSTELADADFAARAAHPCIGTERADLVVAGCAILEAICRLWPVGRLRVALSGLPHPDRYRGPERSRRETQSIHRRNCNMVQSRRPASIPSGCFTIVRAAELIAAAAGPTRGS